jgi:hypothetical protein
LDLEFQRIMLVAPNVFQYVEQPETFRFSMGDRRCKYTPDGLAHTTVGLVYFEVKPTKILTRSPDLDGRLASIKRECASRNSKFEIVTEADIRRGKLLTNSTAIWSAVQTIEVDQITSACRNLRHKEFPASVAHIAPALGTNPWLLVKALLGLRFLATDLALPFSPSTVVSRGLRDW